MSKILVEFIQDRSGSMQDGWEEALSGFKEFVRNLQQDSEKDKTVEYLFSLTTFDTVVDTPIIAKAIADVPLDALVKFGPRGYTALYDAVGTTIKNTEDNSHGADKIIVVIVTDGQENSSSEWSKEKLHQSIDAKLSLGNWTFTYLGTQPETWNDAGTIGVALGSTVSYVKNRAAQAYGVTGQAVIDLAKSSQMGTRTFTDSFISDHQVMASGMRRGTPTPSTPAPSVPKPSTPRQTKTRLPNPTPKRWK